MRKKRNTGEVFMFSVATEWNPKQKKLRETLANKDDFMEAIRLCLELHGIVHASLVSSGTTTSFFDEIWKGFGQ